MSTNIPPLAAGWRQRSPGDDPLTTRDDRDLIRQYMDWPALNTYVHRVTIAMNDVAVESPATVGQIQVWIDEAEDLEAQWRDKVAAGTAHQGNATSYEGPIPGREITQNDRKTKADVLEWDPGLLKVKISGGGVAATEQAVLADRISTARRRVIAALGLSSRTGGSHRLSRS